MIKKCEKRRREVASTRTSIASLQKRLFSTSYGDAVSVTLLHFFFFLLSPRFLRRLINDALVGYFLVTQASRNIKLPRDHLSPSSANSHVRPSATSHVTQSGSGHNPYRPSRSTSSPRRRGSSQDERRLSLRAPKYLPSLRRFRRL